VECKTKDGNFFYDDFEMDKTVVTEWDLVCDRQYQVRIIFAFKLHQNLIQVALVASIYMVGLLFGSPFYGYVSDTFGRKPGLALAIINAYQ